MTFENRHQKPHGGGMNKVVCLLSICLVIVTINTVMQHQNELDIPSIATAEVKQQVAEITRGFESDVKRVEAASQAQVESLKQELNGSLNQASIDSKAIQESNQAEIQVLKAELEALKKEVEATERVPIPFIDYADPPTDLIFDKVQVHGVTFDYAVRKQEQVADMHNQIKREINQFAILKDAIHQSKQNPPLVMDVQRANHGLYSLFAAKLGADVIVVEPQIATCRLLLAAAKKNGVEKRITVYHGAVLEFYDAITMKDDGGNDISIKIFPIYQFLSRGDTRRIAFLKIDVEGFDIHAIQSAASLFSQQRVDNALVEFGPLKRWKEVAGDTPRMGLAVLKALHDEHGMELRVIEGWDEDNVWSHFLTELGMMSETKMSKAEESKYFRLTTEKYMALLMDSLEAMDEESFLWLVPDKREAEYPVFQSECSNNREGKEVIDSEVVMLTSFGCMDNDGADADAVPNARH